MRPPCWVVAVALLALSGCSQPAHHVIIGTWKSDAGRTLESMRLTPGLAPEARARLENDYYGHLIVEYRPETVRARFDNSGYDSGWRPYTVVSVGENQVVTREWNEILRRFETSTTFIDGECIYGISAEYAYREYFCPL